MTTLTVNNRKTFQKYISVFLNFLYLLQTLQYILIYLDSNYEFSKIFLLLIIFTVKLLPFNMKSTNPIQKYPHII